MSSTRTLVTLLRPWKRRFTIIFSAWWLRTSSKFTWEEVKTSTGKLGKWSTPKRVRIRPKHSAPSLSRDSRIKMLQSIINQSIHTSIPKNFQDWKQCNVRFAPLQCCKQYLNCRRDAGKCVPPSRVRVPHRYFASPHRDLGVLPSRVER